MGTLRSVVVFTFTLRTLAIVAVAISIALGALVNPTGVVAAIVVNGVLCAILVAGCLAIATPQPVQSFWFGFSLACLWTLAVDELGRREFIPSVVLTRKLELLVEPILPSLGVRGEPGATLFFRTGQDRLPIKYFVLGDDGRTKAFALADMDHLQREGLLDQMGPMEALPHANSIATTQARSIIFRYLLASIAGGLGGLLAYGFRCRAQGRGET
jgi:hypothetical protein